MKTASGRKQVGEAFDKFGGNTMAAGKGAYQWTPMGVSRMIDARNCDQNGMPSLKPGAIVSLNPLDSKMGQTPIYENGKITNFWVSDRNPFLIFLNYITPGAPSATADHDVAMDRLGTKADSFTKMITIPPYFVQNYYGSVGTPVNATYDFIESLFTPPKPQIPFPFMELPEGAFIVDDRS